MSSDLLSVSPEATLRDAAGLMAERGVDAAVVAAQGAESAPGILTARDVLYAVGASQRMDAERVSDHFTPDAVAVSPEASLEDAAEAMTDGGFRHLLILEDGATVGVVSMRDIVRHWVETGTTPGVGIQIGESMSTSLLSVSGEESLHEAARRMSERHVGSAIVEPAKRRSPPRMVTEREILQSVGAGEDPRTERVAEHVASRMTFSAPAWSLKQAAEAMIKGGFQHIVVVDAEGTRGVISMRDVVRAETRGPDR